MHTSQWKATNAKQLASARRDRLHSSGVVNRSLGTLIDLISKDRAFQTAIAAISRTPPNCAGSLIGQCNVQAIKRVGDRFVMRTLQRGAGRPSTHSKRPYIPLPEPLIHFIRSLG